MLLYLDGDQGPDLCVQAKTDWHLIYKASCETESRSPLTDPKYLHLARHTFQKVIQFQSKDIKKQRSRYHPQQCSSRVASNIEKFCLHPSLDLATMS